MDQLLAAITLAGGIVFVVQGGRCLPTHRLPLSIGVLDLLLAGMVFVVASSLLSGSIIIGTEFGTFMVQGAWARWMLRSLLIVMAVLPVLCWSRIRQLNGWQPRLAAGLAIGLIVGGWAATRVRAFNPEDVEVLRVYFFDVWWPPLIVWLTVCFAGIVMAFLNCHSRLAWGVLAGALVTLVASFALSFGELADWQSRPGWNLLGRSGFPIACLLLGYLFVRDVRMEGQLARIGVVAVVWAGAAAFAILDLRRSLQVGLAFLLLIPPVVALVAAILQRFMQRAPRVAAPTSPFWNKLAESSAASIFTGQFPIARPSGIAHGAVLFIIAVSLADLVSIGYLDRSLELLVVFASWLFLADLLAKGDLTLPKPFKDNALQLGAVKRAWAAAAAALRSTAKSFWSFLTSGKSRWEKWSKAIVAPLIIVFLLIAADEAVNRRSIVIQPFRWTGVDATDDISKVLLDGLVNALGRLRQDLRTDLAMAQRKTSGEHPRQLQAAVDSNAVDAAVAKSDDLQISIVKIPLTFFAGPIQRVVRAFSGVRVITGSVRKNGRGTYTVWANASGGESWQEESTTPLTVQLGGGDCPRDADEGMDAISEMIEKLAFDIASSDPSFIAAGMTKDWDAFQRFRLGLKHWHCFETRQSIEALTKSISAFHDATEKDASFALAFYRLGIALRRAGQPETATAAFYDSVAANPEFISGELTKAATLYDFKEFYAPPPAVVNPWPASPGRREEALSIWTELITPNRTEIAATEMREAYRGICISALDHAAERDDGSLGSDRYLSYFYCSRAATLFFRLSDADRASIEQRNTQAMILDALGVALENHRSRRKLLDAASSELWPCRGAFSVNPDDVREDGSLAKFSLVGSRTSRAALGYYRKSLEFSPGDPFLRCDFASSAAFLGDWTPLKRLARDASARSATADQLGRFAYDASHLLSYEEDERARARKRAVGYYRRAIEYYDVALSLNPSFFGALTGYGAVFWQWKVDWLAHRVSSSPSPSVGERAESCAREAVILARAGGSLDARFSAREALGEALLGSGRMREAVEELGSLLADIISQSPNWYGLNEIRWDLAQARLCSGDAAAPGEKAQIEQAQRLLEDIRQSEHGRDLRPFANARAALNPLTAQGYCPERPDATPGSSSSESLEYLMRAPAYDAGPVCGWSTILAQVDEGPVSTGNLFLRVWGGGLDERVGFRAGNTVTVQLEARPEATHGYYFVQLEKEVPAELDVPPAPAEFYSSVQGGGLKTTALSAVRSVDTYSGGDCSHNRIKLLFAHGGRAAQGLR